MLLIKQCHLYGFEQPRRRGLHIVRGDFYFKLSSLIPPFDKMEEDGSFRLLLSQKDW